MSSKRRSSSRVRTTVLAIAALGAAACAVTHDGGAPTGSPTDCGQAIAHFEELRVESLQRDPVLGQIPGAAQEHARQTHDVFVGPRLARCADEAFVRCLQTADSYATASACR